MILRDERLATGRVFDRVLVLAHLKLSALRSEAAVGSSDLARLGLVVLAMAFQTQVTLGPGHFRPAGDTWSAVGVTLATLVSLSLAFLATLRLSGLALPVRRALCLAALVGLSLLSIGGFMRVESGVRAVVQGTPYNNDGAVMDLYAARRVLAGQSPYVKSNIIPALAAINAPAITTTPLMRGQFRGAQAYPSEAALQQAFLNVLRYRAKRGLPIPPEFESKYNYPAGSFLFILPFVAGGLHDMRFLYALALVAFGIYLYLSMPRALRVLAPLVLLADVPLLQLTAGGQPDPLYGLLLIIGLAEWTTPWLSPLSMGLAVATKQLAWFFVPFYLVLVFRRSGRREVVRRVGIMSAVFLLTNGPFIAQTPQGYLTSLAAPMADPMFPLGVGIIALFVSGVVPMVPKVAFTLTELAVWGGSAVGFARVRSLPPAAVAILGALPLFFAWRSLVNYFYLVPLLALAMTFATGRRQSSTRTFGREVPAHPARYGDGDATDS